MGVGEWTLILIFINKNDSHYIMHLYIKAKTIKLLQVYTILMILAVFTLWPSNSTLRYIYILRWNECLSLPKTYNNVPSSFTYNSSKLKTVQMFTKSRTDRLRCSCITENCPAINKRNTMCNNVDKSYRQRWAKEARLNRLHTVWLHLCEVQEQPNESMNMDKEAQGEPSGITEMFYILSWVMFTWLLWNHWVVC